MTCTVGFNSLGLVTQFLSGQTISKLVCGIGRKTSWFIPDDCAEWAKTLCYSALDNYSSGYDVVTKGFCENAKAAALDCAARINSNITIVLFAVSGAGLVGGIFGHIVGRHPLVAASPHVSSSIKAVSSTALAVAALAGVVVFS